MPPHALFEFDALQFIKPDAICNSTAVMLWGPSHRAINFIKSQAAGGGIVVRFYKHVLHNGSVDTLRSVQETCAQGDARSTQREKRRNLGPSRHTACSKDRGAIGKGIEDGRQ